MLKSHLLLEKSIRNKFLKTFLSSIIVFFAVILIFLFYVNSSNERLQKEQETVREKAVLVDELEESFNGIFFRARGYYAFQDEQELKLIYSNLDEFDRLLKEFSKLNMTKEERELYNSLVKFNQDYKTVILPEAISHIEANDYEALRELSSGGANELVNQFVAYAKSYKRDTEKEINQIFIKTVEQSRQFTLIALFLCGLIMILISLMVWRVLRNLIQPIEQLTLATNAIASGHSFDLGPLVQREDELGVLTHSFEYMSRSINEKEDVLMAQNEELTAQQYELQENQTQLQLSLDKLQKYNQLNHAITFTLNKTTLVEQVHKYLNAINYFDSSILFLINGDVFDSKGLSESTVQRLMSTFSEDKQIRLEEEKSFIIRREITPDTQGIAQKPYSCYDLYSSILNSKGQLVAVMIATREGYPITSEEIEEIDGLMNRVSIAFERINMYEKVESSRLLNQNIIDNVNEGIQFVSISGDIILVNESLCSIVKCNDWIEGNSLSKDKWIEHFRLLCDQSEELPNFLSNAINEHFRDTRKIQYSISCDTPVFVEVYATSVYDDAEKIGTVFVHRDITMEYEVDKMKSELVSTVSHELRTPLSSVLGFTELLLTKSLKPERQKKYIETIHKEAKRLTNLINDFLDLQRMESGRQQYHMQLLSLDKLTIEIVNRFRHEENHNVHLIDMARNVLVKADQERLFQVFMNLISNAIKFSPNGGDITITLQNMNDMLQVSIQDEGIGISSNDISKLFQKFKRIDNSASRKIGGTGLGLAISKEIIGKHDGDIWIESIEEKGTTVHFTLPLADKLSSGQISNGEDFVTGLNVMIVEDDPSLALLLSEELKSKGFTIIHHTNPKRAFEDALRLPLVGAVIDLMLGDEMSGWELVKQLKETEQTCNIPIVISSALDEAKDKVEKYKINKYFTKPYPPEALSEVIVTFLLSESSNGTVIFPKNKGE